MQLLSLIVIDPAIKNTKSVRKGDRLKFASEKKQRNKKKEVKTDIEKFRDWHS